MSDQALSGFANSAGGHVFYEMTDADHPVGTETGIRCSAILRTSSAQPQLVQAAICSDSLRPPSEKGCRLPKPPAAIQERVPDLTDG
jgi:hypothetical protein